MRNRAYMQMKESLVKSAKEQKKPILGHFELTARCNLDCKMCYVHTQNNSEALRKELSTEQWKQIFDEAYDNQLLYASLSGGECLIRKDFKELYLHLWKKHVMITVMTNGTLIDDEYVEFFKTYRPEMIKISLYGSSEEGYLTVTGHKGFDKTIAAIRSLKAAGIDVQVTATPSKYMQDDYINVLQLCKENNFFIINSDIMLTPNREDPNKDDYYLTDEETFILSKRQAELYGPLVSATNIPEPGGPMLEKVSDGLTCSAGNCSASITWDGMMYPCLAIMERGVDVLKLGFAEAWRQTVEIASQVVQARECTGCAYEKVCPKCPAFRFKDLHSGHCNPAVCELTRKLVAAGVKKLDQAEQSHE